MRRKAQGSRQGIGVVRVRARVRIAGRAAAARQVEHPQRRRSVSAEQHALPLAEREAESRRELRLVRVAVGLAVRCVVGSGAQLAWLGLRLGLGVRLG